MLNWAIRYCQLGYSAIPLRPKSKEPLIRWAEFQTRKATISEIRAWWTSDPEANIGLVTGRLSHLAVVDLDGPSGIKSGQSLGLVSTTIVRTGNGQQFYYYDSEGLCTNTVKKLADGVDTRGTGGFVVAPPSIHPNGSRYAWLRPVVAVEKLTPFPIQLFANSVGPVVEAPKKEGSWIAKSLEDMTDGNIDNTLFTVLCRLRNDGYSSGDAAVLLGPHAERVGASPGHLEEKIRNVWSRYEPKPQHGLSRPLGTGILQSSIYSTTTPLQIHSPTNPDSQREFSERTVDAVRHREFPTGYPGFDALTGGLRRGEILTVAARTGVGKTNWLIGPCRSLCEEGKKVLLFSTEMSFDQIWGRYRATLKNDGDFAQHKFYVCDEFAPNTARVEEALKQIMPDVFVFDHINNVGEEHHQLSEFMKGLKLLARKFNIPCIMTAQLNRTADWVENGERVPPRLSMIKGSGTIEEVSAQVLLLSETRVDLNGTEITGVVDKNRYGNKGMIHFLLKNNPYRVVESDDK